MIRFNTVCTTLAITGALAVGCNRAADEQKKADEARAEAVEEISEANREATEKVNEAVADAEEEVAEAQANFVRIREDYRHQVTKELADIDQDIASLEAKTNTATGREKAKIESNLPTIRSLRENVSAEYNSLESAAATTWDATKKRVDKAIESLKEAVDRVD